MDAGVDEFDLVGLEKAESRLVRPPRVARAKAHLECRYLKTVAVEDIAGETLGWGLILGQVIGVHISDDLIRDGMIDVGQLAPLSRLGYLDYGVLGEIFAMPRPGG